MDNSNMNFENRVKYRPPKLVLSPNSAPPSGMVSQQQSLFDFKAVLQVLRRRAGLIIGITILCALFTVLLDSLTPKVYSAETRLLLDEQNVNPFGSDEIFSDLRLTNPVVESQMQVIRSPFLLSQVIDELDLANNAEFMATPTTPAREQLKQWRASVFSYQEAEPDQLTEAEQFQNAAERLRDNLRVSRNAQTFVIQIRFTSASPELAAEVVNAVADIYIGNRLGIRQNTAERAAEWFDERMAELNIRAIEVEQQMEQLSGGGTAAVDASQVATTLQDAREKLQSAMAERAQTQAHALRLKAIVDSGRGLAGVSSNLMTEPMRALMNETEVARIELARTQQQDPTNTVALEQLQLQIGSLEATGASMLNTMLQDAEVRAAQAAEAAAVAQETFETARASSGGSVANAIEVELRSLEGEARIYRELHDSYLESYLRTIQQQSFPSTEATIIQTAQPPQFADGPGLSQLGVLAVLIGLTFGAGGAFVIEASDGRVRTVTQLTRASGAPFLGLLPIHNKDQRPSGKDGRQLKLPAISAPNRSRDARREVIALPENRVPLAIDAPQLHAAITNPLSIFSESIRRVNVEVDNLQNLLGKGEPGTRIIGFISDRQSTGRSISAINYAEMLAVGGRQTLLIDLDWTGMFLTEKITPGAQFGLAELAMVGGPFRSEHAFWYDERTSLHFLPNRSVAHSAAIDPAVFDQRRLKALVHTLSAQFDSIVIDLSPLSVSSDAAAMAEIVSGFVAVADWGQTKSSSLATELRRASIYPPKLIGTLLNGVSAKQLKKYETAA